jgi:hypothetical protein
LTANIRLEWKLLAVANVLAYNTAVSIILGLIYTGKNRAKLVGFIERKKYFAFLKPAILASFLSWCKDGFSKKSFKAQVPVSSGTKRLYKNLI